MTDDDMVTTSPAREKEAPSLSAEGNVGTTPKIISELLINAGHQEYL
jgi:hypothetical protein